LRSLRSFAAILVLLPTPVIAANPDFAWPTPTRENRPWTRWWWLGSAVDKTNLTRLLTEYHNAGLGGVEICPIYGAKGYESRFLDFLSPPWMEMLAHTSREAKRLGMGMDLTTGTGWPFGGPNVTPDIASAKLVLKKFTLSVGDQLKPGQLPPHLQCLRAISDTGEQIDLTGMIYRDQPAWTAPTTTTSSSPARRSASHGGGSSNSPPLKWSLYAVALSSPVQKVKRAAPSGEGSVLDPYSVKALERYLARFDQAFTNYSGETPRSQFHDSFEYYGAQWTPDFFTAFEKRRGYDLRTQLPALFGEGPEDTVARVKSDYRETISDLHLAYIERWTKWCHDHGSLSRDQAHGSPGNLLDIYAAADIPETEIFGSLDGQKIALNKFSSSAAHITGHQLASSESFTWLNEHFQASLSEVKQAADYLFLSGVNHIFFHGIPYSPTDAPWPGWQFYAAVNFGPQGGLWHDLPAFNSYVTRCQSILQSGDSDNDVLVYYPVHDYWNDAGELIRPNPMTKAFTNVVANLWERGYAFDYVSDRSLANARADQHRIVLGDHRYRAIVVPECRVLPDTALAKLASLARDGAHVLFQNHLPNDVPGFANLEKRRNDFRKLLQRINVENDPKVAGAQPGERGFVVSTTLEQMTYITGATREPCVEAGISFVRRTHPQGFYYFFVNRTDHSFDGWITLATPLEAAEILDPRFENRRGIAETRPSPSSRSTLTTPINPMRPISPITPTEDSSSRDSLKEVHLQLQPGESCILRTFTNKVVSGPMWPYRQLSGNPQPLTGTWKIEFIEGGPELPAPFETRELASWTKLGDAEAKRFAGTARYNLEFDCPTASADDWLLNLGNVCESARVKLNGQDVATLWCAPFQISVGKFLRPGKNKLEIEVTNLAANRIADLDRRKVNWKYFYDINLASKRYRSLDASDWPLRDSGLLGPVTLQPLKAFSP
jgi:hypothetical protein